MADLERRVAELLRTRQLAAGTSDPETRDKLVRLAAEQADRIRLLVGQLAEQGC